MTAVISVCIKKKLTEIGEFLSSHFNIDKKEATFLAHQLYYFKNGKNAPATHKKICTVFGEGAVTDRTCQTWFAKFRAGDFLLEDAPRSG